MSKILRRLSSQVGFTLIETMIGAGLLGGISYGVYHLSTSMSAISNQLANIKVINEYKQSIIQVTKSNAGWTRSIAESADIQPSLKCLVDKVDCKNSLAVNNPIPVKIVRSDGVVLTDPTRPNLGFNTAGEICNNFSAVSNTGTMDCPFRFETTIRIYCPNSGPCTNPQEKVIGTLVFSPGPKASPKVGNLNASKYTFDFLRGELASTLMDVCRAFGGDASFDPATKTCSLPMAGECPDGQVVVSIDKATNRKDCRPLIRPFECGPDQVLKGISDDGTPMCFAKLPCPVCVNPQTNPQFCCEQDAIAAGRDPSSCWEKSCSCPGSPGRPECECCDQDGCGVVGPGGPGPSGPGPSGPGPSGPGVGPSGPGPSGPGPSGPGVGPRGPGPWGPGTEGPGSGPVGAGDGGDGGCDGSDGGGGGDGCDGGV